MEGGEGMVAVVRGLRDSGLAVTLLDGSREYTLMPNSMLQNTSSSPVREVASFRAPKQQSTQHNSVLTDAGNDNYIRNTGAQVTDGRYASIYKTTHCHVKPSSPPTELTEFPPQRAELCPGHGNFEVGGTGSGERYSPIKANGKFRGGMSWPDRGAVCSPRASHETDAFANSLRKYPCVSPDRSSEIVERLINYTQSRASKTYSMKNQTSPPRSPASNSYHNLRCSRTTTPKTPQRYEPGRDRTRVEESPTRDRAKKADGDAPEGRKAYSRNYDVKCFKDLSKRVKNNIKIISTYPYNQAVCPPIKECHDNLPPRVRRFTDQLSNNSVNTAIQTAVRMVSREVATRVAPVPSRRTVAVPLSPTPSIAFGTAEGDSYLMDTKKSTQKTSTVRGKSVQTVSFTDLTGSDNDFNVENIRRSKSQEELRMTDDYFKRKVLAVFANISCDDRTKETLRDECLRRLLNGKAAERSRATYNRCIDTIPSMIPQCCREFEQELVEDNRDCTMGAYNNITQVFHAQVAPFNVNADIDFTIKDWVDGLPINMRDVGCELDKREILNNMANKLKELIVIRFRNEIANMKSEILEMIESVPIDTNASCNKRTYLNKTVDALLERIRTTFVWPNKETIHRNAPLKTPTANKSTGKHTHPTKEHLKVFVRGYLSEYFNKINMNISDNRIHDIENELADIFTNAVDQGNHQDVRHQIKYILTEIGNLTDDQSNDLTNMLLEKFKKITMTNSYSQIFTVLQNTSHHSNTMNSTDFSIEGLSEGDLNANLDIYMNQLCVQIDDWLTNLNLNQIQDKGFKQVVVHDLASDIIDRHKYLEFNPASRGTDDEEIEQLKYQIFKWVNKLVGEDNTETIQHAQELMTRIRTIPVPMLIIPANTASSNQGQGSACPSPQCQNSFSKCGLNEMTLDTSNNGRRNSSPGGIISAPNVSQGSACPRMNTNTNTSKMSKSIPQGTRSELGPTVKRNTISLPSSPQINRNLRENRMSYPGATSGAMTRGPNISLPAFGTNPGIETGPKVFPSKSDPAGKPQVANGLMNEASGSTSLRSNISGPQPTCCPENDSSAASIKKLNDEFDEYLKNWVKEIPIVVSTPEEEAVAEKARLGIFNGIWKTITRLQFEPSILFNRFYYQDVLDDEIEDLINILPKTPELESKKYALKARLIEKTSDTTRQIMAIADAATYKHQLVENVENSLPNVDKTEENHTKVNEELQKLCLVDEYIMYTRYKDGDPVKANVYRKKLIKHVQTLIDDFKKNHGKEYKDIDPVLYVNEVVSALNKVPIPSENTIREEADEILLGIEIEQWFSDLPHVENNDYMVQLQHKRLRDALTKKIHELEKERNLSDCVASKELKRLIVKFLDKVSLQQGTDINFITDELTNRLKNRSRDGVRKKSVAFQEPHDFQDFQSNMQWCSSMRRDQIENDSIRRRSVGFQEPQDYLEFSKNMPGCSSFSEQPPAFNDSPRSWPNIQTSGEQWLTLEESRIPQSMAQNGGVGQAPPLPAQYNNIPQSPFNGPTCPHNSLQSNIQGQNSLPIYQRPQDLNMAGGNLSSQRAGASGHYSRTASTPRSTSQNAQDAMGSSYRTTDRAQQQNNSGMYPAQQIHNETVPERVRRDSQQMQRPIEGVSRMEAEDTESETERDICRCRERFKRRRRRPMIFPCGEYDMKCPQFIPIRCPYAYFF